MPQGDCFTARLDKLETLVAHQERTIEDLQKVIADQWTEIERLTRKLATLGSRVEAIEERADGPTPVEPPPPHY